MFPADDTAMVIVDTSVWVNYFRGDKDVENLLSDLLVSRRVSIHSFVIGEIALGSIADRAKIIAWLKRLHRSATVDDDTVLEMMNKHTLFSLGIGLVDMHLIASASTSDSKIWTRDNRLGRAASMVQIALFVE